MAGAGFRTFTDGQVLTAAQVNNYLMEQSIMVFATAAARTTALPTPSEGMFTYRTDANVLEYYDGAAWQPILDQDVIQAKGDLIVGTGDDTVARLAVGTNGQFLTADSTTATGLKWSGAVNSYTSLATGSLTTGTSVDLTSISGSYQVLEFWMYGISCAADFTMTARVNNDSGTSYRLLNGFGSSTTGLANSTSIYMGEPVNSTSGATFRISIPMYASGTSYRLINCWALGNHPTTANDLTYVNGVFNAWYNTAAINRLTVTSTQTFTAGTYVLWGIT